MERDFNILKALYYGNHLNDVELSRAENLLFMLKKEFERRLK